MIKKSILIIFSFLLTGFSLFADNVHAYFTISSFYLPGKGPYIETYLSVVGNSILYLKKDNGKFQGAIEVGITIKKDSLSVYSDRFNLLSPEVDDSASDKVKNFIDQQRISLPNGDYVLYLSITDKNKRGEDPFTGTQKISLNYVDTSVVISDIEFLENYNKTTAINKLSKSGYDLLPYNAYFFPRKVKDLKFYTEIYNTPSILNNEKYIVKYFIEQYKIQRTVGDLSKFIKMTPENVNVVMADIPIDSLPSGNYNLVIEVRNKENILKARKSLFFQRSNPTVQPVIKVSDFQGIDIANTFVAKYTSKDTLAEMINCLRPISTQFELLFAENDVMLNNNLQLMQQYFYDFWLKRDQKNPNGAWAAYRSQVIYVNKVFGNSFRKGYDTDRGRVYLQYGPPNVITKSDDEPAAYPYEIWQYYTIKDQSNKKFLFYEPDVGNNEYILLHSDFKGETYNADWDMILHKRTQQFNNIDMTKPNQEYGGKAEELFGHPR